MNKYPNIILSSLCLCMLISCSGHQSVNPAEEEVLADVALRMHRSSKRGVAFNLNRQDDALLLTQYISWNYNWGISCAENVYSTLMTFDNVEFCPMAWNGGFNESALDSWCYLHPETKYLLAYNEPNLTDQARMTPQQAAEQWPRLKAAAERNHLKIIAPALNYGTLEGYFDPIKWYDEFFQLIPIDDVDGLAIHCYMASNTALMGFVKMFGKYNKPIWLTEFCAWDAGQHSPGNVEGQIRYMCNVLNWLEMFPQVERYAWFIPRANTAVTAYPYMQMLTHEQPSQLTELGKIYCGMSSFDKSVWLDTRARVHASEYVEVADSTIQVRTSTDDADYLKIDMGYGKWTDYQVYFAPNANTLELRYSSYIDSQFFIYVDGELVALGEAPKTQDGWATVSLNATLPAGKHKMRVEIVKGGFDLLWFRALTK
ncbi:MAG: glycosyl hydrolase [Paludibacter sp.]|nr:glycosyl hydrolase [Bacteroidales bacterium]MCM1069155.1 glycosyl hydrolase [Prevotella sp.]MCM1353594.1 glycosyl hydrolase [Bacteroides sp.]MCM1442755.1 glycosyl hydrolase [Muribaculum sp.]MCM1481609.1 glycosyl hydrolase [Paludibacter sp.]